MKELLVVNQPWTSEIQKYLESTGLVMQLQYEHHSVSVVQATFSNWIQLFDFLAKYDSTVFEDKLIRVSIRSSNLAGKYSEYLWNSRMLVINPPLLHSQIDHSSFTLFGDIFFHHLYKLPLSQLRFFRQYQKKPVGFIQYRSPEVMKLAQVSMNKSYLAGNQISTRPFNNPDSLQLFKKCTAEFSLKVSNIPTNTTTKTQLVDLLYSFGHARLDKNRDDLLFHYENAHDRENAIRYFDKNTPFGTDIEVKSFLPLSESIALQRYNDACRVYFFNACPLADYKEIYDIFKLTGSIKSLVIDKRSNANVSQSGVVVFDNPQQAYDALLFIHEYRLRESVILCYDTRAESQKPLCDFRLKSIHLDKIQVPMNRIRFLKPLQDIGPIDFCRFYPYRTHSTALIRYQTRMDAGKAIKQLNETVISSIKYHVQPFLTSRKFFRKKKWGLRC